MAALERYLAPGKRQTGRENFVRRSGPAQSVRIVAHPGTSETHANVPHFSGILTAETPDMIRREIIFRGRVQGVGFRATTAGIALRHPVAGWVRNEPDRSVRVVVEGLPRDVEQFLDTVRAAFPGHITAEEVVAADAEPTGLIGFDVRR